MKPKPASCVSCPLYKDGLGFCEAEGEGSLGVMIVGEASGAAEAQDGLPFRPYAESGSVLEQVFRRLGYSRSQFAICNVVSCRPPGNLLAGEDYEQAAISNCRGFLDANIARYKPRAILALGGIATRTLTEMTGARQGPTAIRGFVLEAPRYPGIPVIPSYHPAFLRRGKMAWLGVLIRDLELAVQVARNGPPSCLPKRYIEQPTLAQAQEFLEAARHADSIAVDIETAWSHNADEDEAPDETVIADGTILTVQFSLAPGTGISFQWTAEFQPIVREILALDIPKLFFNGWHFDIPKLRENGCVVAGRVDDVMWAWHHAQPDLPRNLQFVASQYCPEFGPWKHLAGANLAWYGAADVDILQRIWPKLRADMEAKDIWRGYERHVRQLWPLLERMSERGLPVSAESQASFRAELDEVLARVDGELQEIYPEELKELHPPKGFVREPADTTGMRKIVVTATRKEKVLCACVDQETGLIQGWTKKASERCKDCKGTGLVRQVVTGPVARWAEVLPFKPSQQQLVKYMHFRKHQVPKAIGSDRDTTSKLFIERMAKRYKDPLYPKLLEYRSTQKMLSTYLDGWAPGPDGLVHAIFKFSPATGQLAASAPNVLTLPTEQKAGKLGLRFRETLQAKPGYVLVEADMSGFHTSTFAFESKDKDYWRLANTIGDPHSFLTAVLLGLGKVEEMLAWDDEKLRAFLAKIKKEHKLIRDGQAKPAILGYALGLGANKLYELNRYNPETGAGFKSKSAAGVLIDTLRATFPRGYAYQQEVRLKAHLQTYLLNAHGFIRYFWDVMHRDGRSGETILGEQAEAAIAFNVQADAHGHLKDAILRMEAKGWLEKYGLCNIVHDSVVFHARKALLEEVCYNVLEELRKPSDVLVCPIIAPGGLAVGAEAKFGPDMAHMETWKAA